MSYTIAICGKGGTGKTTLAALIVRWLLNKHKNQPILAIDADPNANLDLALGIKAENSIVAIVDEISKNPDNVPQGMTKDRFLEYRIQDSLIEAEGFDLLVMGRPEGPGCYCFVNNLLRSLIVKLTKSYAYLLIDNEAGMEHLSRRTARIIDLLLIVSDYSIQGLRSAKRILDLTRELELSVKEARLIVNKATHDIASFKNEINSIGIPLGGIIPDDPQVSSLSVKSGDLTYLNADSKAAEAISKICEEVIKHGG